MEREMRRKMKEKSKLLHDYRKDHLLSFCIDNSQRKLLLIFKNEHLPMNFRKSEKRKSILNNNDI